MRSDPYPCWDIDGTLVATARAGTFAWKQATRVVLGGAEPDMASMQTVD